MNKHVKEGEGWRLGWNPTAEVYCGLVAGDRWSVELTAAEFADFCRCARQLANTMQEMTAHVMDEETLTCEQETAYLWIETDGFAHSYSLRFLLLSNRRAEGEWTVEQTSSLIRALKESPFDEIE